ncbi:MAG: C40 family peptidase [Clostridia bacterium]|nr:C40 family peptidase [Clostridia bacterium]
MARFRYGCPYFYGGYNENILLKVYRTWQNSHYYLMSNRYLGGFDCIGFARWVHTTAGDATLPAISKVRAEGRNNLVDVSSLPYEEWQNVLLAGDCVNIAYSGGGYHIGIYIGTLREFGFTAEDVGEPLVPYLDHPLIIHCGMNNFHTAWYAKYLSENGLTSVTPPDGGVTISVMGVDYENCPYTETMWQGTANVKTFYWFDLMGYNLTVINPIGSNVRWMAVYRSK